MSGNVSRQDIRKEIYTILRSLKQPQEELEAEFQLEHIDKTIKKLKEQKLSLDQIKPLGALKIFKSMRDDSLKKRIDQQIKILLKDAKIISTNKMIDDKSFYLNTANRRMDELSRKLSEIDTQIQSIQSDIQSCVKNIIDLPNNIKGCTKLINSAKTLGDQTLVTHWQSKMRQSERALRISTDNKPILEENLRKLSEERKVIMAAMKPISKEREWLEDEIKTLRKKTDHII